MSKKKSNSALKKVFYILVAIVLLLFIFNLDLITTLSFKNNNITPDDVQDGDDTIPEEPIVVPEIIKLDFSGTYSDIEGVLTFRGNNFRTAPAYGTVNIVDKTLKKYGILKPVVQECGVVVQVGQVNLL